VEDAWAELREAQDLTARKVRNSGLAVAIDIGERNDIHPRDKQNVGLRLALQALRNTYGLPVPSSGPTFKSLVTEGNSIRVRFDHTDGGLKSNGDLKGFQVAGSDGKFYWADARIDGDSVVVSSARVSQPVSVRYAWDTDPEATLYNGAGLPAVPFRTDHR
jgi:sialate O-acetylesterase